MLSGCSLFSKHAPVDDFLNKLSEEHVITSHDILLPEARTNTIWHDDIDIVNSNIAHFKVSGKLDTWSLKHFAYSKDIVSDVVCDFDKIFIMTNTGVVVAIDKSDYCAVWTSDIGLKKEKVQFSSMSIYGNKLYVTANNYFLILSVVDGEELVRVPFQNYITSGVCLSDDDTKAYIKDDRAMYSVDTSSGRVTWILLGTPDNIKIYARTKSLLYKGDLLITDYSAGQLSVIESKKGGRLYQRVLFPQGHACEIVQLSLGGVICQPILDKKNDMLYFAAGPDYITKYDLKKQKAVWSKKIPGIRKMLLAGNTLFATTMGRQAVSVNIDNGQLSWVANLDTNLSKQGSRDFLQPLLVNENLVVVSANGEMFTVNPFNGRVASRINFDSGKVLAMCVIDDQLKLFTKKGMIEVR
ncbi:outer membrane protein assembly factor BamB family protein [Candidatus Sneabacter namystus]|uniref:PQQ-binding-like beta-propeller repeat protein n=1 Tax=Candidatus Sneabacter namystus TaxID=2601646 RepID=A0A5C0ULP9_9RICK|nr:PQQ-binding-like beta-propeller repeat protein [Candidatus Sneabacter namystus]QEK39804.1 PQQ-binding-like beta-propeller repeat protein [Candidatus Sneabacter namystus]